jgi:AraC-like DNA-binding protein
MPFWFHPANLPDDFPFTAGIEGVYSIPGFDSNLAGPHVHDCLEIAYCHSGKGFFQIGDKALDYKPGDILVIPPNVPHIAYYGSRSVWTWISCDPVRLLLQDPSKAALTDVTAFAGNNFRNLFHGEKHPRLGSAIRLCIEECRTAEENFHESIRGMILYILAYIHRVHKSSVGAKSGAAPHAAAASPIDRLRPALDYMHVHFSEKIPMAVLAKECAMSEVNFRRVFHSIIGKGPHDYLTGFRIAIAARRLREGNENVETVSAECGFEDPSAFRRAFRLITRRTPSQWRSQKTPED